MELAESVPPYRLMDDMFSWVCGRPIKPCYIMDLPRERGAREKSRGHFTATGENMFLSFGRFVSSRRCYYVICNHSLYYAITYYSIT